MNKPGATSILMGGLGNYMFQVAATYAYAKKYDMQFGFNCSESSGPHKHVTSYEKNIFNGINLFFFRKENYHTHKEIGFSFKEIPNYNTSVILYGYFQSEKYFKNFDDDIRCLFTSYEIELKQKIKNLIENKNTCSIHIRRGDFLKYPDNHPIQDMNYYTKAIKKMPKDSVFLIFSDDIKWCKENFPNNEEMFIFVEGNEDYEDLKLMSMCKNNIICNSTFSWWGAWLNNNPNKIVVAPKKWFGPSYKDYDTSDLYCEDWILL